ncbi:hypothetical protein SAMN05446037_10543 [Anaerovirgula multivorans]|uniref:CobQ/CobB/MinD/ParA nucleotide binding domain-containing protein n=1 Tax=Anaerovirgula multivorans TaxID=312168 RepID=A0A239KVF3_9FIRM|nr:hypothetical protein [Anaerovirgula multivorans]SNT21593.1 hypothetical protein SAMN05446037_10543 [Anaerovirgula multivorans]
MLLYLTSNENVNLFDFLENEHGIIIKKLSGHFSMKQFVIQDMRSLEHYRYMAVDVNALKDVDTEIIEAVNAFKKLHSSRLIFYMEDIKKYEQLIHELINTGIYNILTASDVTLLKMEILKAISNLGISKREIQSKFMKDEIKTNYIKANRSFIKKEIKIAVTGVQNRVGTTTMAINLANFLWYIGARVCYVEANEHHHLIKLSEYYQGMREKDGVIFNNGVKYLNLHSVCHDEFDFIIYDMGVVNNKIIAAIRKSCDVAIICATGKPYESNDIQSIESLLDEKLIYKVFSLVAEFDKSRIKKQDRSIYFSNYTPDYFDSEVNDELWEAIIKPFVNRTEEA